MRYLFYPKTLYILLLFFVFASVVFLYFLALRVDRKYSQLIVTETQVSANLYKIANLHSRNINLLFNALYTNHPDSVKKLENEWQTNVAQSAVYLDKLSEQIFLTPNNKQPVLDLAVLEKDHLDLSRSFFEIKNKYNKDSAFTYLRTKINPSYYLLRDKLELILNVNNKKLLEISDKLTAEHTRTGLLYLTLGTSPLIIFALYLLAGLVLLIYLAIQIFRTDHS